jgi:hypothetical protein
MGLTRFFRLSVNPFGKREMNLFARDSFGFVRFLEAIPDKIGTYVGVCHPCRSPKRYCASA